MQSERLLLSAARLRCVANQAIIAASGSDCTPGVRRAAQEASMGDDSGGSGSGNWVASASADQVGLQFDSLPHQTSDIS